MLPRFIPFLLRSLSGKAKAGWLFIAGGLWPGFCWCVEWLADKAFGDAVFSRLTAELSVFLEPAWQAALWTWGPTVVLVGAGIYLLVRGDRPPVSASAAPMPRVERTPQATVPTPDHATPPEADWGKLYELADDGKHVRLRFLPDTPNQEDDTVLLVVLGFKVMKGQERVFAGAVDYETRRAMREAPNSRIPPFVKGALLVQQLTQRQPEVGQGHVDRGLLRRVGLAQGGFYELTAEGEESARMTARDLIRRA